MSYNHAGASRYGVHSIDHFALNLPSLPEAEAFFKAFGLDVERGAEALQLRAAGRPHVWGRLHLAPRKSLAYLSFNCWVEEYDALVAQVLAQGGRRASGSHVSGEGAWFLDPDGNLLQVKVGAKTSPDVKAPNEAIQIPAGARGVDGRRHAEPVRPTRLSHVFMFTPDIERAVRFYVDALGLRLSDGTKGLVAFMHGRHGSDHHLVAFVSSKAKGWHHSSWDVPGIEHVGSGAEQMRKAGHTLGWGTGRHVLGSNYFHYVRDPWGSFAEYSAHIDYVPAGMVWPAGDYPPEDSLYLWGPELPAYFLENTEA